MPGSPARVSNIRDSISMYDRTAPCYLLNNKFYLLSFPLLNLRLVLTFNAPTLDPQKATLPYLLFIHPANR